MYDPEVMRQVERDRARQRQRELADIRRRIEADAVDLHRRIQRDREHDLPAIYARMEADKAAREAQETRERLRPPYDFGAAGPATAAESLAEAQKLVGIASAALGVVAAVGRMRRL